MQRDCVIIGAGLSGLAAADELEQRGVEYTLIEVKPQVGGSIRSHEKDGYIVDEGPMALTDTLDEELATIGLDDALIPIDEEIVTFRQGTQMLVNRYDARIKAPRMLRMAVSSIGAYDDRFSLCFENGLVLDAKAVIVAVPARYAERLFYGYISEATQILLDYRYDRIYRVSIGCPTAQALTIPDTVRDMAYVSIYRTDHPDRTPPDHTLIQVSLRAPDQPGADTLDSLLRRDLDLPEGARLLHTGFWSEGDPLTLYEDDFPERLKRLRALMPDGVELAGSDYSVVPPLVKGAARLDDRIVQGRRAAANIAHYLRGD